MLPAYDAEKVNRLLRIDSRIAGYERPWVGRVGLVLVVALWLFMTVAGFALGLATGLVFLIVGAVLIAGEVWIERDHGRHATVVMTWRLSWRIAIGLTLIILGIVRSESWGTALLAVIGAWLIVSGVVVARLRWLEIRGASAATDE